MPEELDFGEGLRLPVGTRRGGFGGVMKSGGVPGVLGFAAGWAITQAITDQVAPTDPNKGIYDVAGGLVGGTAMFLLFGTGIIQVHPIRWKI